MLVERPSIHLRDSQVNQETSARIVLAAGMLCGCVGFPARAQDAASAEQFLRQLYADEAKSDPAPNPDLIYDPQLLTLIQKDRAMMQKFEKGLLRVDPICACQDPDGLQVLKITAWPNGPNKVDATVSFIIGNDRSVVGYQLVNMDGQWRIHDILGGNAPSLRQYLITGLARE